MRVRHKTVEYLSVLRLKASVPVVLIKKDCQVYLAMVRRNAQQCRISGSNISLAGCGMRDESKNGGGMLDENRTAGPRYAPFRRRDRG